MDTPDRPRAGAGSGAAAGFEDSPVFNFINNLSPIPPPKPLESAHNVQLFKSSDLAPISSIFTSPHVNLTKEPKLLIRDESIQLSQESNSPNSVRTRIGTTSSMRMIECKKITSENCNVTCYLNESSSIDPSDNTSNSTSDLPQSIQLGRDNAESDENQNTDGQTDLTLGQECTVQEYVLLDQSGPNEMVSSHSGRHAHENQLDEQHKDELVTYDGNYLITHQACSDMLTLAQPLEAETQPMNETSKTDEAYASKSLLTGESSGSYIHNSAHEPHLYWSGAIEGSATDYTPQTLPGACQTQLVLNEQTCNNKLNEPGDYMPVDQNALSQNLRGMRRRCLFNEKPGTIKSTPDNQSANSTTPRRRTIPVDNSKPPRTPPCALPGIGLHLNALATIPKDKSVPPDVQTSINQAGNLQCAISSSPPIYETNVINDDSSQVTTVAKADVEPGQGSPKKKRFKFDNGDGTSCKRCSCKKSKCLKLYCECFHAGVFCSEPCSCQGCLNKPCNMETVLSTRELIESRNPLAFAPKVIRTSEPGQEPGDDSNRTPASARHKRGCNCKKSSCLKKYCECYQGGVGCSISCRCEGCKNAFGKREGVVVLSIEEAKRGYQEKLACVKEEKSESDKQLVICQATDLAPTENVLTPSIVDCRPLTVLPPSCSKKPRSSAKLIGCSSRLHKSQAPVKSDIVLSPFENYAEIILGEGTSDTIKVNSPPENSVKVVSPNKKRISPPRIGTGLSPICKSGRKLILKSIPSFPSLVGDVNSEDPKISSPAP